MDRRDATGAPDRLRALPCARQSRSLAAQLELFDSRYCALSAGCTAPLVFMPTGALVQGAFDPARCRLSVIMLVRACERRTVGFRGQRDGRESQYVIGILGAACAHEGLAVRKLGVTTLDVRRHSAWHLGVADDTERDKRHEDRGAAPAANQRH